MTTHEPRAPVPFRERLLRLLGGTTYRQPVEGRGSRQREVPAEHELAAALGMARRHVCAACGASGRRRGLCAGCGKPTAVVPDPLDVGPDIAADVLFGTTRGASRVCRAIADAIGQDRARLARRNRPWLRLIAWAAYAEMLDGHSLAHLRPADSVTQADWDQLVEGSRRVMEALADEAVGRAARAWRAAA
jgi:hypothetical protein